MKNKRLLHMMGEMEDKYVEEAYSKKTARASWLKWCTMAAGFVLIAGLSVVMTRSGMLFGKQHEVTLQNGEKITFAKIDEIGFADQKINATARDLTKEEAAILFQGFSVTGYALFDADNGSFMGIEGDIGEMDLFVAKKGIMIDDTIVVGEEEVSGVNGVDVTAGYFLTSPNSKGERKIIYYANFEMGDTVYGLEHAGPEAEAATLRQELADVIEKLIANGEPDFGILEE